MLHHIYFKVDKTKIHTCKTWSIMNFTSKHYLFWLLKSGTESMKKDNINVCNINTLIIIHILSSL